MKVGVIGVGEMGAAMGKHLVAKGHEVFAYDIDASRLAAAAALGIRPTSGLADIAGEAELLLVIVSTDEQSREVTDALSRHARANALIAVVATNSPKTMQELAALCAGRGKRFIDAPVVYGASGAREGTLLSLCGGDAEDV